MLFRSDSLTAVMIAFVVTIVVVASVVVVVGGADSGGLPRLATRLGQRR